MKLRTTIKGLDISAILHPKDKSTLDKLRKIPGFKSIVVRTTRQDSENICVEVTEIGRAHV